MSRPDALPLPVMKNLIEVHSCSRFCLHLHLPDAVARRVHALRRRRNPIRQRLRPRHRQWWRNSRSSRRSSSSAASTDVYAPDALDRPAALQNVGCVGRRAHLGAHHRLRGRRGLGRNMGYGVCAHAWREPGQGCAGTQCEFSAGTRREHCALGHWRAQLRIPFGRSLSERRPSWFRISRECSRRA